MSQPGGTGSNNNRRPTKRPSVRQSARQQTARSRTSGRRAEQQDDRQRYAQRQQTEQQQSSQERRYDRQLADQQRYAQQQQAEQRRQTRQQQSSQEQRYDRQQVDQQQYAQQQYDQQQYDQQQYAQQRTARQYAQQSAWQQQAAQRARRRRGGGCLLAVFVFVLIIIALAAVLVFGRPILSNLGLLNYLPSNLVELIPTLDSSEGELTQRDHEKLHEQLANSYVYGHLSNTDQEHYRIMYDALVTREQRRYPYEDGDELSRIRNYIIADHPELFYVSGVNAHTVTSSSLLGQGSSTTIEGIYRYDIDDTKKLRRQLEETAVACIEGIPEGADDYAKAKYLYDYIVKNVEYDWSAYEAVAGESGEGGGQTAVDALIGKKAVCAGYSSAFQYLAQQLGFPCVYVTGTARDQAHAWNAVQLDGGFYYVDTTWGDPQFIEEGGEAADISYVNHDYLCVTTEDILKDHVIDKGAIVPDCTSTTDNYYRREGLYLETADVETAGALIRSAADKGQTSVQFRCAARDDFDFLCYSLFDLGEIYGYLEGDTCWYTTNENLLSVTVIFS